MSLNSSTAPAKTQAFGQLDAAAVGAVGGALNERLRHYDRAKALARFHRLSSQTIESETPAAARIVLAEIERALRAERARMGHWSYDLDRHIALMTAYRAEAARLAGMSGRLRGACGA